jgi:hypothetical protein
MQSLNKFTKLYCSKFGKDKQKKANAKYNKVFRLKFGDQQTIYLINDCVEVKDSHGLFTLPGQVINYNYNKEKNFKCFTVLLRNGETLENVPIENLRRPTADVSKYYIERLTLYVLFNYKNFDQLLNNLSEGFDAFSDFPFVNVRFVTEFLIESNGIRDNVVHQINLEHLVQILKERYSDDLDFYTNRVVPGSDDITNEEFPYVHHVIEIKPFILPKKYARLINDLVSIKFSKLVLKTNKNIDVIFRYIDCDFYFIDYYTQTKNKLKDLNTKITSAEIPIISNDPNYNVKVSFRSRICDLIRSENNTLLVKQSIRSSNPMIQSTSNIINNLETLERRNLNQLLNPPRYELRSQARINENPNINPNLLNNITETLPIQNK